MEKIPMTPRGFEMLEAETKRLKTEERPAIIRAIAEARGWRILELFNQAPATGAPA